MKDNLWSIPNLPYTDAHMERFLASRSAPHQQDENPYPTPEYSISPVPVEVTPIAPTLTLNLLQTEVITSTLTPSPTFEVTTTPFSGECFDTDLKGEITSENEATNENRGNNITGYAENLCKDPSANRTMYVHMFGSNQNPDTPGWIENQSYLGTCEIDVPPGTENPNPVYWSCRVPENDFRTCQVDLNRVGQVMVPPRYPNNSDDTIVINCGEKGQDTPRSTIEAPNTGGGVAPLSSLYLGTELALGGLLFISLGYGFWRYIKSHTKH